MNEIFERYLQNRCSPEEIKWLVSHFQTTDEDELSRLVHGELERSEEDNDKDLRLLTAEAWSEIKKKMGTTAGEKDQGQTGRTVPLWPRFAVAASILLLLGLSIYFLEGQRPKSQDKGGQQYVQDLAPGRNKAYLTLGSGRRITLDDVASGKIGRQRGTTIDKTAAGQLVYTAAPNEGAAGATDATGAGSATGATGAVDSNVLETPNGGQYQLTLPDGTRVWLNAASKLTYPSTFNGAKERIVSLNGEAYFEVVHHSAQPFKVKVAGQTMEDLGTQFNINAYSDEAAIRTTLLEGSVSISNKLQTQVLQPGQQAVIQNDRISLNPDVDPEEAIAWHKGYFMFNDADIQTVMRQLARWYDVDITYEGKIPQREFSGKLYRNVSALKVSDILHYKQINFRIEGRKIIVMP